MHNSLQGLGLSIAVLVLKTPENMHRKVATHKPGSWLGSRTSSCGHMAAGARGGSGGGRGMATSTQGSLYHLGKPLELTLVIFHRVVLALSKALFLHSAWPWTAAMVFQFILLELREGISTLLRKSWHLVTFPNHSAYLLPQPTIKWTHHIFEKGIPKKAFSTAVTGKAEN